jgi:hypothetical protein
LPDGKIFESRKRKSQRQLGGRKWSQKGSAAKYRARFDKLATPNPADALDKVWIRGGVENGGRAKAPEKPGINPGQPQKRRISGDRKIV